MTACCAVTVRGIFASASEHWEYSRRQELHWHARQRAQADVAAATADTSFKRLEVQRKNDAATHAQQRQPSRAPLSTGDQSHSPNNALTSACHCSVEEATKLAVQWFEVSASRSHAHRLQLLCPC